MAASGRTGARYDAQALWDAVEANDFAEVRVAVMVRRCRCHTKHQLMRVPHIHSQARAPCASTVLNRHAKAGVPTLFRRFFCFSPFRHFAASFVRSFIVASFVPSSTFVCLLDPTWRTTGMHSMVRAYCRTCFQVLQQALRCGMTDEVDLNCLHIDPRGDVSLLMRACELGHAECVRTLAQCGADLNLRRRQ